MPYLKAIINSTAYVPFLYASKRPGMSFALSFHVSSHHLFSINDQNAVKISYRLSTLCSSQNSHVSKKLKYMSEIEQGTPPRLEF
jgi:hypothetical protein